MVRGMCSRKSRERLRRASVGNLTEDEPQGLAQWSPKRPNMQRGWVLSEGMMDVSLTESGRPWERAWGECKREDPEEDGKEHKHT
jgi:hypothetical protein